MPWGNFFCRKKCFLFLLVTERDLGGKRGALAVRGDHDLSVSWRGHERTPVRDTSRCTVLFFPVPVFINVSSPVSPSLCLSPPGCRTILSRLMSLSHSFLLRIYSSCCSAIATGQTEQWECSGNNRVSEQSDRALLGLGRWVI